jgi:hypothetical protein
MGKNMPNNKQIYHVAIRLYQMSVK